MESTTVTFPTAPTVITSTDPTLVSAYTSPRGTGTGRSTDGTTLIFSPNRRGAVGLVTLNRPQAMNALSNALLSELMDALDAFDSDEAINVMVIAGDQKAFAAGADIKEMADKDARA